MKKKKKPKLIPKEAAARIKKIAKEQGPEAAQMEFLKEIYKLLKR